MIVNALVATHDEGELLKCLRPMAHDVFGESLVGEECSLILQKLGRTA